MHIKKRTNLILVAVLLNLSLSLSAYAVSGDNLTEIQKRVEDFQNTAEQNQTKKEIVENRMTKIKDMLLKSYNSFQDAEKQINLYEKELEPIKQEITTLEEQISSIDYQLDKIQSKITNIKLLIEKRKIDIAELMEKIEQSQVEMEIQKKMVKHYLKLAYFEDQKYKTKDDDRNFVNFLLADARSSELLQKEVYINVMEDARRQVFYKLEEAKNKFKQDKSKYEKMRENLENLKALVEKEQDNLRIQQIAKEDLLEETKGKETEYQRLLEESKQQQAESVFEIQNLQNNLEIIRDKLKYLEVEDTSVQPKNTTPREAYSVDFVDVGEMDTFLAWPVPPQGGVTAYFQDESYFARFKVIHNAIDIRQAQGSPVFAPANGYVYKVKDNGMGYSYIILAHRDGFMTVYGHISEMMITEGEIVHTGDLIGLSGGMPGTKGAGWMTTGPHLHFEVYKDGTHVDPLEYLPLDELPIEYIPAEYLKKIKLK